MALPSVRGADTAVVAERRDSWPCLISRADGSAAATSNITISTPADDTAPPRLYPRSKLTSNSKSLPLVVTRSPRRSSPARARRRSRVGLRDTCGRLRATTEKTSRCLPATWRARPPRTLTSLFRSPRLSLPRTTLRRLRRRRLTSPCENVAWP